MDHLQAFQGRDVRALSVADRDGWRLKRYAILAEGREFSDEVAAASTDAAFDRLPAPGPLEDVAGNHGVGFQIIHFAEVAVVSPVFYWQWGSVLAHIQQIRAPWSAPTAFDDGQADVFGCVWEMELVAFEVNAWKTTMLDDKGTPDDRLTLYLNRTAD
ncbi:hypothetical protein [uncultured Tateyamaria sp.]|uniref:hypothetical protein n=1 Tax=uncultured Tateyamaria sp. TaxID=455651 RepID=UPI0026340D73|nr:hypothetical protein [uncultured Tateyamaria sp.]